MKKIICLFALTFMVLSGCGHDDSKNIIHKEKVVYNLCEISSYLGIHGEINGGLSGGFFLGFGSISGGINGQLDDVPKAFCVLEKNGNVEMKSIPMDQLSVVYINDSTQQRAEAYIKYELKCSHTNLCYDYSDVKLDNLNNYTEVVDFNISNYNCYSIHPYSDMGSVSALKSYVSDFTGNVYPGIDPNTTIYYKIYILEKNVAHLSNMKNFNNGLNTNGLNNGLNTNGLNNGLNSFTIL